MGLGQNIGQFQDIFSSKNSKFRVFIDQEEKCRLFVSDLHSILCQISSICIFKRSLKNYHFSVGHIPVITKFANLICSNKEINEFVLTTKLVDLRAL